MAAADKQEITMVLKVDLDCERCNKKIRKVLQKIQGKMNIKTTSFDEKRNVVTISGPFDADKVRRKLCCEAGRIIKGIDDVMDEEKDDEDGNDDGDKADKEEDEKKPAVVVPAADEINLRPLLQKMLERPKARPQQPPCECSCGCTCSKQTTTRPPAQGVAVPSVWPAPASSVSVSVSGQQVYEAPSPYYGVPVYSIKGWY